MARLSIGSGYTSLRRAQSTIKNHAKTVVFVTNLLRMREIKLAAAARHAGWKVVLVYFESTPFNTDQYFDCVIKVRNEALLHATVKKLSARVCHVFSGAIDDTIQQFCQDKPCSVIVDLNDVFCPALFNILEERFEPTRKVLASADGFIGRDLQANIASRVDGYKLPPKCLFFPEYSWINGPNQAKAAKKHPSDEVHVVSVGTFTLEKDGFTDSGYLRMASLLAEHKIHFHIYPHWFYSETERSGYRLDRRKDFVGFYELGEKTGYVHVHKSLSPRELALELPQYDFGIVTGGSGLLGQRARFAKERYMNVCYSGRISDYLDARLPVLINKEVKFNYWLLGRYNCVLNMDKIRGKNFKEYLISCKSDPALGIANENAASSLSLLSHASRLGDFYAGFL